MSLNWPQEVDPNALEQLAENRTPVLVAPVAATSTNFTGPLGRARLIGLVAQDNTNVLSLSGAAASNVPAAGASGVVTVSGVAGSKLTLTEVIVSLSGTIGGTSTLTIKDGATTVFSAVLPATAGIYTIPITAPGIVITAGATLTVTATTPGASGVASVNVVTGSTAGQCQFELYDGHDTTGAYLGTYTIPIGGTLQYSFGISGPNIHSGIYINVLTGTLKGSVLYQPIYN